MTPTQIILDQLANLLATDPTTLAPVANAVHIHLIQADFVPGPTTDFTTLTEATFTGSAAKSAGLGAQQHFTDPVTGDEVVQLLEPAGGWHWPCTAGTGLPQTIFGWCATDNADAVTYGSELFPNPIVITASGQAIDIAQIRFNMPPGVVS